MPRLRPKQAALYGTVGDWWQNQGGVSYIAHAVTATGVTALGAVRVGADGGTAANHPDQQFWAHANQGNWPAHVLRVEIDCSLMPCTGLGSCLYAIPNWLNNTALANAPLRIFSHRDEGLGATATENKRVFYCNPGDNQLVLDAAYNAHENWFWVANADPRVNNAQYHLF